MTPDPGALQKLRESITELNSSVQALENTLESDYPTRAEIKKRRKQLAMSTIIAIVASYFISVGTINYCFLGDSPADDHHYFCNIFPGYNESMETSERYDQRFAEIEKFIEENRELIEDLRVQDTDPS